jgi:hypothetical protein
MTKDEAKNDAGCEEHGRPFGMTCGAIDFRRYNEATAVGVCYSYFVLRHSYFIL